MGSLEALKSLRDKTGAGMVDCKKALDEAGDDMDKAIEILRKAGIAKAAKRGERDASEGLIKIAVNEAGNEGYIVEVNTETDFVARNDKFQDFVNKILEIIKEKKPASMDELKEIKMEESSVGEALEHLSGTVGEKMEIKGFEVLSSSGTVTLYSHMGGRIGVLAALDKPAQSELAHDIAMQVAAANPKYIRPDEVPEEEINKEKEIYREQLLKEGKPENIIDKILEGKINKYYEEVCLMNQEFIKDDKKKVSDVLGDVKVERFVRYSL